MFCLFLQTALFIVNFEMSYSQEKSILLHPHFTSICLILPPHSSFYLLLIHVTSHCLILPPPTSSFYLLLPPISSCALLPPPTSSYYLSLRPCPSFYLPLPHFTSSCLLLLPSFTSCSLISTAPISSYLLILPFCLLLSHFPPLPLFSAFWIYKNRVSIHFVFYACIEVLLHQLLRCPVKVRKFWTFKFTVLLYLLFSENFEMFDKGY